MNWTTQQVEITLPIQKPIDEDIYIKTHRWKYAWYVDAILSIQDIDIGLGCVIQNQSDEIMGAITNRNTICCKYMGQVKVN